MNSITRLVALVAGLVFLLNITPSWGQPICVAPGCNPTTSDGNFNTATGSHALVGITTGFSKGYRVVTAETCRAGLLTVKREPFSLVISDLRLPRSPRCLPDPTVRDEMS